MRWLDELDTHNKWIVDRTQWKNGWEAFALQWDSERRWKNSYDINIKIKITDLYLFHNNYTETKNPMNYISAALF